MIRQTTHVGSCSHLAVRTRMIRAGCATARCSQDQPERCQDAGPVFSWSASTATEATIVHLRKVCFTWEVRRIVIGREIAGISRLSGQRVLRLTFVHSGHWRPCSFSRGGNASSMARRGRSQRMRDRRCPRPQREGLGLVTKDGGRVDRGRKLVAYAAYVLGR